MGVINKILIATKQNHIYLKPQGHITANLCFPLREMIFKRIKKFNVSFNVYVDLSEIKYMDSTFLGLMVGIEKKLAIHLHTHLILLNPNDISKKIIRNIGLNRFLKAIKEKIPEGIIFSEFDDEINIEEIEKTRIVLNSHKNLMELSEENRQRFQTLTDTLEKKIDEENNHKAK